MTQRYWIGSNVKIIKTIAKAPKKFSLKIFSLFFLFFPSLKLLQTEMDDCFTFDNLSWHIWQAFYSKTPLATLLFYSESHWQSRLKKSFCKPLGLRDLFSLGLTKKSLVKLNQIRRLFFAHVPILKVLLELRLLGLI